MRKMDPFIVRVWIASSKIAANQISHHRTQVRQFLINETKKMDNNPDALSSRVFGPFQTIKPPL